MTTRSLILQHQYSSFGAKQCIPEFFLFHKIKSMLKWKRFEDTEDIKRNVTKGLLALHAN
jgi:hypothetical protein